MHRRYPTATYTLLQMNCYVMRVLRSLYYIYYWYLVSSGNNKNVFRCSWLFYLIPINHEHPDTSLSVQYRHTCLNYDLTPCRWPTVAPGTLLDTECTYILRNFLNKDLDCNTNWSPSKSHLRYCYTAAAGTWLQNGKLQVSLYVGGLKSSRPRP